MGSEPITFEIRVRCFTDLVTTGGASSTTLSCMLNLRDR